MRLPLAFLATAALLACAAAAGKRGGPLAEGTWGGQHIRMEVTAGGAEVELDCAHGGVEEPIVAGADGRFAVAGYYVREHGGPVREGEEERRPARYEGRVEGKSLSLTIVVEGDGETLGPFTLVHGRTPRLTKCL